MTKRIICGFLLAALIALGACSGDDGDTVPTTAAPATTETTEAEADVFDPPETDPEPADTYVGYVDLSRDAYPGYFAGVPDSIMESTVYEVCAAFDRGVSAIDILITATDAVGSEGAEPTGFLIGAGVQSECPEYIDQLFAAAEGLI